MFVKHYIKTTLLLSFSRFQLLQESCTKQYGTLDCELVLLFMPVMLDQEK